MRPQRHIPAPIRAPRSAPRTDRSITREASDRVFQKPSRAGSGVRTRQRRSWRHRPASGPPGPGARGRPFGTARTAVRLGFCSCGEWGDAPPSASPVPSRCPSTFGRLPSGGIWPGFPTDPIPLDRSGVPERALARAPDRALGRRREGREMRGPYRLRFTAAVWSLASPPPRKAGDVWVGGGGGERHPSAIQCGWRSVSRTAIREPGLSIARPSESGACLPVVGGRPGRRGACRLM